MAQKTWFITGVSTGLGRTLAELLLRRGDRVAGTARKPEALAEWESAHRELLLLLPLELTDFTSIHHAVHQAFAALGRIDIVVNNAGYALFGAAEEATSEQIEHCIRTNLTGSIEVIRAALPRLRAQGGGRIVQISSEGGQIAYPNFSVYHAAKWGIEGFLESTLQDVAPFHIEFTIVEPGPARTEFGANLLSPPALPAYADTPAGAVRRAISEGAFEVKGDPVRIAERILEAATAKPAPRRVVLGSDAYEHVHRALTERLWALEAQKEIAFSTDFPG